MANNHYTERQGGDNTTDFVRLGEQLRELRAAQGLSHEDVARATKVRPHLLQAIEDGSIEDIAAPVYVRGFVKTYCEYLLADDLWRKYSSRLAPPDTANLKNGDSIEPSVDINHPTPMFRRSSIIWVYVILVIAVFAAAVLLWNQQRNQEGFDSGFFLRIQEKRRLVSSDEGVFVGTVSGGAEVKPAYISPDAAVSMPAAAGDPASADRGANETGGNVFAGVPANLSWMGEALSASVQLGAPIVLLPRQPLSRQELLIEITGGRNRLVVNQGGRNVTTRDLGRGETRSYYVTTDTEVNLGAGISADVTWFGKRYVGIGIGNAPLSLIFYPDGRVRVTSGSSPHFGSAEGTAP
ncbi:MAG: helix-turn-helix domain-containing protein [Synergistaceae bacterium]|jgi:hypothetical protein|nr:helix-turn-helix domain-containing protein [Synergistaceae bacterium]